MIDDCYSQARIELAFLSECLARSGSQTRHPAVSLWQTHLPYRFSTGQFASVCSVLANRRTSSCVTDRVIKGGRVHYYHTGLRQARIRIPEISQNRTGLFIVESPASNVLLVRKVGGKICCLLDLPALQSSLTLT